jgi:hypothetical protein
VSGETCGAEHPEKSGMMCDREPHQNLDFHRHRASGAVWPGEPRPVVVGTGRAALAAIAARTTRHHPTGPASGAVTTWKEHHG